MVTTKKIKDVELGDAILFKNIKFKVEEIHDEGKNKKLKLITLSSPREILISFWSCDMVVEWSKLDIKLFFILKHIKDNIFELNNFQHIDVGDFKNKCINWIIENKKINIIIFDCFNTTGIMSIYSSQR